MSDDCTCIPEHIPVFPLPRAVLFPRQILPLHIFEERYRAMVADALEEHRFLAVALLKPDYEPTYFTQRAPIHSVVGIGRIEFAECLDDGKYNILLRGLGRARILEEFVDRPYRLARIAQLPPAQPAGNNGDPEQLRNELRREIQRQLEILPDLCEQYLELFDVDVELGDLVDMLSAALPVNCALRQIMLEELDPLARGRLVLNNLDTLGKIALQERCRSRRSSMN